MIQTTTRLDEMVESLRKLQPGWDGHDAPAISEDVIARALEVVQFVDYQPVPALIPMSNGSVLVDWERIRGADISAEITNGGMIELNFDYQVTYGTLCAADIVRRIIRAVSG